MKAAPVESETVLDVRQTDSSIISGPRSTTPGDDAAVVDDSNADDEDGTSKARDRRRDSLTSTGSCDFYVAEDGRVTSVDDPPFRSISDITEHGDSSASRFNDQVMLDYSCKNTVYLLYLKNYDFFKISID